MATQITKNIHLLWRAGFGPMAESLKDLETKSSKVLFNQLLNASQKPHKKIVVSKSFADERMEMNKMDESEDKPKIDKEQLAKQRRQMRKEELRDLNLLFMDSMTGSAAQLKEKVSLFWHGHFACRILNSFFQQELIDIIRVNALGNFKTLLKEVSKSAAIIDFLNNQKNKKNSPNENFAREVMELFTLGRGNYTENDIKEAARAFTGWGYNANGKFVFRKALHDDGSKTVLSKTGNFDGDAILDILLEKKQTAYFITKKIYKFFVNENFVDEKIVNKLGDNFYNSNYEITPLLKEIFLSDWFYNDKNIGTKIKSPVELLMGIKRFLPFEKMQDGFELKIQRALGQVLFYPPNVAGWPGGKSWIDSSSLLLRMKIPLTLGRNDALNITLKDDDDVMGGMNSNEVYNGKIFDINWDLINKYFSNIPREKLYEQIEQYLLLTTQKNRKKIIEKFVNSSTKESYIKNTIIQIMATPEYQLC